MQLCMEHSGVLGGRHVMVGLGGHVALLAVSEGE
jgi:hypothetical protein